MLQTGMHIANLTCPLHGISSRSKLAEVHEHPFYEVWNTARLKRRFGSLHPAAAYNALAALSQVTESVS